MYQNKHTISMIRSTVIIFKETLYNYVISLQPVCSGNLSNAWVEDIYFSLWSNFWPFKSHFSHRSSLINIAFLFAFFLICFLHCTFLWHHHYIFYFLCFLLTISHSFSHFKFKFSEMTTSIHQKTPKWYLTDITLDIWNISNLFKP
jgi:hypothetical protein